MKNLSPHTAENIKIVLFCMCLMPFARLLSDDIAKPTQIDYIGGLAQLDTRT